MIRAVVRILAVVAVTAVLYAALYWGAVMSHRSQLVVFVPSMDPEFQHHGRPTVSLIGVGFYALVLFLHALAAQWIVMGKTIGGAKRGWLRPTALAFGI